MWFFDDLFRMKSPVNPVPFDTLDRIYPSQSSPPACSGDGWRRITNGSPLNLLIVGLTSFWMFYSLSNHSNACTSLPHITIHSQYTPCTHLSYSCDWIFEHTHRFHISISILSISFFSSYRAQRTLPTKL